MKRYPKYKDSGIDWIKDIPYSWNVSKIKYLSENQQFSIVDGPFGTQLGREDYVDEGVPLVRIKNLSFEGNFSDQDLIYITEEKSKEVIRSSITKGDIIIGKTGFTIGKVGIFPYYFGIISSSCLKFTPNKELVDYRFIKYHFTTDGFYKELLETSKGSTRDTINIDPFKNLVGVIPPLPEQLQIVSFLDHKTSLIDDLINKELLKIELLKESIVNYLHFKKDSYNIEILNDLWFHKKPKSWKVLKFKEIFNEVCDKDHSEERLLSVHQIKGVIYRDEQQNNVMNPSGDISNYKLVQPGDFIISLRSSEGGIEHSEVRGVVSPVYTVLRPKFTIDTIFYKYLFKTTNFIIELNRYIKGIREGKSIYYSDIKDVPIPIISTFDEIVSKIHFNIFQSFSLSKRKIDLLKEYRQSLISEVVTGKIDVRKN